MASTISPRQKKGRRGDPLHIETGKKEKARHEFVHAAEVGGAERAHLAPDPVFAGSGGGTYLAFLRKDGIGSRRPLRHAAAEADRAYPRGGKNIEGKELRHLPLTGEEGEERLLGQGVPGKPCRLVQSPAQRTVLIFISQRRGERGKTRVCLHPDRFRFNCKARGGKEKDRAQKISSVKMQGVKGKTSFQSERGTQQSILQHRVRPSGQEEDTFRRTRRNPPEWKPIS